MIKYSLRCADPAHGGVPHEFEGWFRDSAAFEKLLGEGMVECPACGGTGVGRALMAPAIPKKGRPARHAVVEAPAPVAVPAEAPALPAAGSGTPMAGGVVPAQVRAMLQRIRAEVEANCDYVGGGFAEEARKMAAGESEARGIYGEASDAEAEALRDEGIEVARIPWVPRSDA